MVGGCGHCPAAWLRAGLVSEGLVGLGQCLPTLPPRRVALGGLHHICAACSGDAKAWGVCHPLVTMAGTLEAVFEGEGCSSSSSGGARPNAAASCDKTPGPLSLPLPPPEPAATGEGWQQTALRQPPVSCLIITELQLAAVVSRHSISRPRPSGSAGRRGGGTAATATHRGRCRAALPGCQPALRSRSCRTAFPCSQGRHYRSSLAL